MSERNEIYELALKFIESEEMREYWGDTLLSGNICTGLIFDPVRDCREFITGSRSSIDDKLAALRKLPPDKETLHLVRAAEAALTEVKNSNGNVFLTTLHFHYDNTVDLETWDERKPFLSFESVISYVQRATAEQCKIYGESLVQCMERIWYEVEKFIPDGTGELVHKITWTLNAKGEILFFELPVESSCQKDDDWKAWFDWEGSGNWSYPPVPFDFGDVITIDMRPFYEAFHGVIVRIEDNRGCCAVGCISCDADGYLYCSALKHGMDKLLTKISPLYRAQKFMGELPENEQVLKIISEAIKKVPSVRMNRDGESVWRQHELAEQFDEFFCEFLRSGNSKKRNDSRKPGSCSWDHFRERFNI